MSTTAIRNAGWVIAWDAAASDHRYMNGVDVVFRDAEIIHVGVDYTGDVDIEVDGRDAMVMPGLISTHAHLNGGNLATGFLEEVGDPMFGHSPMYTRKGPFWISDVNTPGREGGRWYTAAMHHALDELLGSGVTTVVDNQGASDADELWLEAHAASGIRGYIAPGFQEAQWRAADDRNLEHDWDQAAGRAGFEQACATLDMVTKFGDGRLTGMMFPAQVDTVSEGLMRESRQEAERRGLVWQTHSAQSVPEFRTMMARNGVTPTQWLADIGVLDEGTMLAHSIYLDHHSSLAWHTRDDLAVLADSGTAVAHCPLTFSRWGTAMESFISYSKAGVKLSIGNDTGPHNMLEEIRCAFTQARVVSHEPATLSMADVFRAATVGGADALGRSDLGRIAVGAKADLVLVDLTHQRMQPVVDPLRALVFVAADRAVRDVYVDGRLVYADNTTVGFDAPAASAMLTPALETMIAEVDASPATAAVDDIATLAFPITD